MATEAEGPQERRLAAEADPVVARRYLGAALCFERIEPVLERLELVCAVSGWLDAPLALLRNALSHAAMMRDRQIAGTSNVQKCPMYSLLQLYTGGIGVLRTVVECRHLDCRHLDCRHLDCRHLDCTVVLIVRR